MKRDICTRCERAMDGDVDTFDGASLKVRDRYRTPRGMWTSRRTMRGKHDLCARCAGELSMFLRKWPLAPPKPPTNPAVGSIPGAKAASRD